MTQKPCGFPRSFVCRTVLRVRMGKSQSEVADAIGISQKTVSRWCAQYIGYSDSELRGLAAMNTNTTWDTVNDDIEQDDLVRLHKLIGLLIELRKCI